MADTNKTYNVPDDGNDTDQKPKSRGLPNFSSASVEDMRRAFTPTPSDAPAPPADEETAPVPTTGTYPGFAGAVTQGATATQTPGSVPILRGKMPPPKLRAAPLKKPAPEDDQYVNDIDQPPSDDDVFNQYNKK